MAEGAGGAQGSLRLRAQGPGEIVTRGLFISINGFSPDAVPALVKGNAGVFLMMDGAHLVRVLEGHVELPALLTRMMRHLNTRGEPYSPVGSL